METPNIKILKKRLKELLVFFSEKAYLALSLSILLFVITLVTKTTALQALQDLLQNQENYPITDTYADTQTGLIIDSIVDDYTSEYSDAPQVDSISNLNNEDFLAKNFSPEELVQLAQHDEHVEGEGVLVADTATQPPIERSEFEQWAYENGPTINFKRKDGTVIVIHACEKENMITKTVFGVPVTMHKEMAPYLEPVIEAWQHAGGNSFYKIPSKNGEYVGSYSCRMVRGSTTRLSNHAYGLAIDINPTTNPYVIFVDSLTTVSGTQILISGIPTKYSPPTLYVDKADYSSFVSDMDNYTDMPPSFVTMWKSRGWGWGGNFTGKKDAMHFSLTVNEGGAVASFTTANSYGTSSTTSGTTTVLSPITTTSTTTSTTTPTHTTNSGSGNQHTPTHSGTSGSHNPHTSDENDTPGNSGSHVPEDRGKGRNKDQDEGDDEEPVPTTGTVAILNNSGRGNSQNRGKNK